MIEIVLHLIILRQAEQVTVLHIEQIFRLTVKNNNGRPYIRIIIDLMLTLAFLTFMIQRYMQGYNNGATSTSTCVVRSR
jgi:hypothetical protein